MRKPKIYSFSSMQAIDEQIPKSLLHEMKMTGWNAFGIYELVAKELRKEKRRVKKSVE